MPKRRSVLRLGVVALLAIAAPAVALAYVDPGSGAYAIQAFFTLVATALFYLRHPGRLIRQLTSRLKAFLGRPTGTPPPSEKADASEPSPP